MLAPALGIVAALPIYRSEWGGMGTTSRRFTSCNSQVRGVPLKPEDELYRDVEYYLSYMSNGLPISGPGARHDAISRSDTACAESHVIRLGGYRVVRWRLGDGRIRRLRRRFQGGLGQGRSRQQAGRRAQEPMDHDRGATLKAAQTAAAAGKYDEAVKHAQQAEALANASIAQAKEQETAWKQAVIH